MTFFKYLCGFLFFLPASASLSAQESWILKDDKNGIKVYTRSSELSTFNELKIELDLEGTIAQLYSILSDVAKYTDWFYSTKSNVLVKRISKNEFIYYSEIRTPWPARNRDEYINVKMVMDYTARSFHATFFGIRDYGPEKQNLVRVPMSKTSWYVTTTSDNSIHVSFFLSFDAGGNVPGWIVNLFVTKGPIESFTKLRKKMSLLNNKKANTAMN